MENLRKGEKMSLKQFSKIFIYLFRKSSLSKILSDEKYAKINYFLRTGKYLNYKRPTTFDEKLWYLNIYDKNHLQMKCTDKLLVRRYIEDIGLKHILTKIYGEWSSINDINFNTLPDECFLKCNHTSGGNIIYRKNSFNKAWVLSNLNKNLKRNYYKQSHEQNYKGICPKIFAEELLENSDGSSLTDYKFYCFNGEAKVLLIANGVCNSEGDHSKEMDSYENFYDEKLNTIEVYDGCKKLSEDIIVIPKNIQGMFDLANKLAKPFKFVRVDLYSVNGKIYFGELTFYPANGVHNYKPSNFNNTLGRMLNLQSY